MSLEESLVVRHAVYAVGPAPSLPGDMISLRVLNGSKEQLVKRFEGVMEEIGGTAVVGRWGLTNPLVMVAGFGGGIGWLEGSAMVVLNRGVRSLRECAMDCELVMQGWYGAWIRKDVPEVGDIT